MRGHWRRVAVLLAALCLGWRLLDAGAEDPRRLDSDEVRAVQHYDADLQADIDDLWRRIEAVQGTTRHGSPATQQQLDKIEHTVGFPLPGELKASLMRHAGWEVLIDNWSLHSADDIYKDWRLFSEFAVFYPNITALDTDWWHPGLVPFAKEVDGEFRLCVHVETGEVMRYHGEKGFASVAKSYRHWLESVAEQLEAERGFASQ